MNANAAEYREETYTDGGGGKSDDRFCIDYATTSIHPPAFVRGVSDAVLAASSRMVLECNSYEIGFGFSVGLAPI